VTSPAAELLWRELGRHELLTISDAELQSYSLTQIVQIWAANNPRVIRRIAPDRRQFTSPPVQSQFSLRKNRNQVHIVQTKSPFFLSLTRSANPPGFSDAESGVGRGRDVRVAGQIGQFWTPAVPTRCDRYYWELAYPG
jgi:hypothetical protein